MYLTRATAVGKLDREISGVHCFFPNEDQVDRLFHGPFGVTWRSWWGCGTDHTGLTVSLNLPLATLGHMKGTQTGSSKKLRFKLQWRHNGRNGVSNHRRLDCLLNRVFRRKSKKTSKFRVTGLCEGNSPVTSEFPTQRPVTRNFDAFIWWRHHVRSNISRSLLWFIDVCMWGFRHQK